MQLTKTQKIAVETENKNILVSAGAGTGKTRVLVERFLYFVTSGRVLVTEILALTFTEKAANEMKSRILCALAELKLESAIRDLESAYISTIHSFAARLLREHPLEAGVDPDFHVIEAEETQFLKEQSLEETMELHCQKGNAVFELLRTYGEDTIKEGMIRILNTARHEGKYLKGFFTRDALPLAEPLSVSGLLEGLGEQELLEEWRRFEKLKQWDWEAVEAFKEWFKPFSKRGGKEHKAAWKKIGGGCRVFLSQKIENFMAQWSGPFEELALYFEEHYETKKKEKSFLDFDDLQIKAIQLFKKEDRIHQRLREGYQKKFRQILVDEFQDTNYLQMEFIELLAGGNNLFLVGDFKQSIYGFRGAEPRLFLEQEETWNHSKDSTRIPLLENFRTAPSVLNFINPFFEELWAEDSFPFERLLAKVPEDSKGASELLCVEIGREESLDNGRFREADLIGDRILELREEGVTYGDIAVLFQAMTDIGIYEQALKKRGIPYYALSGTGFYYQPEIRDLISYLSFLENPLADIPLAASLRSPLFQVSDNSLFWLAACAKSEDKLCPLYNGIKQFEAIPEITAEEKQKLSFFCSLAEEFLEIKDRLKIAELVDLILARTSYELMMLADPQGVRRYANLKKLVNLARDFESREPMTLGAFLRTLRRLEMQEARESEAQVEAEQSGKVVRLSSIHRAKGLEFPVVFVADLGRSRQSSESATVIAEAGMGYALQVRNEITLEQERPWKWLQIYEAVNRKEREEWKRLLYVAMTRAKQRLILSGVYKEKKEEKDSFHAMSSWMDWIMRLSSQGCFEHVLIRKGGETGPGKPTAVLAERKEIREIFTPSPLPHSQTYPFNAVIARRPLGRRSNLGENQIASPSARNDEAEKILARITEKKKEPSRAIDLPVSAYGAFERSPGHYLRIYEIGYPSEEEKIAEIREYESEEEMNAAPACRTGRDFGTAMHALLERIDFKNPHLKMEYLLQEIFGHFPEGGIHEARNLLTSFIGGPLFARIQKARRVYRELPFVLHARHGRIDGIIDLLFQDESLVWHVLDYKTAVGDAAKVQEACYGLQVGLYAFAVYKLLGSCPQSGIIHFLKNQWTHAIDFDPSEILEWGSRLGQLQTDILQYRQTLAGYG